MKKTINYLFVFGILFLGINEIRAQENIALIAEASTEYVSSWESLASINDGNDPSTSHDRTYDLYGNWGGISAGDWCWVQYDLDQYYQMSSSQVYWFTDYGDGGVYIADTSYVQYWNLLSGDWENVPNSIGNGVEKDQFNTTTFDPVLTNKIRLNFMSNSGATGLHEWKVYGVLGEQVAVNSYAVPDSPLEVGNESAISIHAVDINGEPVSGYIFKLAVSIKDNVTWNKEKYSIAGSEIDSDTIFDLAGVDATGMLTLNVGLPAEIDPADGFSFSVLYNDGNTVLASYSLYVQGEIPPVLNPDVDNNTVDNNLQLTFTDNPIWRDEIYEVLINGETLRESIDYKFQEGVFTLIPSEMNPNLITIGEKIITIRSAGFEDASVTQLILAGTPDLSKSSLSKVLGFYPNSSAIVEVIALDQFENPVEDYSFSIQVILVNNNQATAETYQVLGYEISEDAVFTTESTNEDGYTRFRVVIPETLDLNDGFDLRLLNNESQPQGETLSYRYMAAGRKIVIPGGVKSEGDYNFTDGTAQSDHFILFWGGLAGSDPTTTSVSAANFDPVNVLKVLESVYDCYAKEISFLDTTINNPATYKFIVIISNTWESGNYTEWAVGGTADKGIGYLEIDPGATKSGNGLAHEFGHACQFSGTNTPVGGMFFEVDANFLSIQYDPGNITSVDMGRFVLTQHFPWLTIRHWYVCWYFLQHLCDEYGNDFISRCYNEGTGGDLISNYKYLLGKTQEDVCDEFGRYAMKNVTWDYSNGSYIRDFYTSLNNNRTIARDLTILDTIAGEPDVYIVPYEMAPGDYGYNKIQLFPDDGTETISVSFSGFDNNVAPGGAGWRYGFVAVKDSSGTPVPRYSDLYSGQYGEVTFSLKSDEDKLYFVVCATPNTHHGEPGDDGFTKNYRYPYMLQITGALPGGYKEGYNKRYDETTVGGYHSNGGGWVASTAVVASTAYVGPNAQVLDDAIVSDNARIEGYAIVEGEAEISGDAIIRGNAIVGKNAQVYENAIVEKEACVYTNSEIYGNAIITGSPLLVKSTISGDAIVRETSFLWGASDIKGTVVIGGDVEAFSSCSKGVYRQYERSSCDRKEWVSGNNDINPVIQEYYYPYGDMPTAPENITLSDITTTGATISWDASIDDDESLEYWVLYNNSLLEKTTATSIKLSGLKGGRSYNLSVMAKDAYANFSPQSEMFTLTTLSTGVQQFVEDEVIIYPNPVNNELNIELCGHEGEVYLEIINVTGATVYETTFEQNINLGISGILSGEEMCFVKLTDKYGLITTKKVLFSKSR